MSQIFDSIVNGMMDTIKSASSDKTSAYSTDAVVRRIDGGTAWVHIDGGVDETPVELTIDAKVGDTVKVNVSGGRAWIIGNSTAPPTDDTKANGAYIKAESAEGKAVDAALLAEKAGKVASNTNQYFWVTKTGTDTGAHVTEIPQSDFLADPENGGGNLLARSNGIAVRNGLDELASFTATSAQVGNESASHTVIDADGLTIYAGDGETVLAHIGNVSTQYSTYSPYLSIGQGNTFNGHNLLSVGIDNNLTSSGNAAAIGHGLIVGSSDLVLGQYNLNSPASIVFGNGTSNASRTNTLEFYGGSGDLVISGDVEAKNNAPLVTSGYWKYKKYQNGTFEAWYKQSGTVTLNTLVTTGWYRNNNAYSVSVPPEVAYEGNIGNIDILFADVHVASGLAGMCTNITDYLYNEVSYYAICPAASATAISSRAATITAYVFGTWR